MCSGGRIVNYLTAMLGDPRHEIVFLGYQVKGTPGAVIQTSKGVREAGQVKLDGGLYDIKAKVLSLGGYPGHADQAGLLGFVFEMDPPPKTVVLVHGAQTAKRKLLKRLALESQRARVPMRVIKPR